MGAPEEAPGINRGGERNGEDGEGLTAPHSPSYGSSNCPQPGGLLCRDLGQ